VLIIPMIIQDKLAQMKAKVKPHTLRKAAITADQLRRRYVILADASNPSINLLAAARWFNKQEPVVQTSLDNADPLTWLRHLLDKHGLSARLPWHLTALIIEEYAKSLGRTLPPIPEDRIPSDIAPLLDLSPTFNAGLSPRSKPASKSPSSEWSWTPPPEPLEPSLSRKRRTSPEAGISFEPQVDSGKSSAGADSRRSSLDPINHRRHSLAYGTDSTRSSLHNGTFSAGFGYGMSPPSNRTYFREFATRMRRKVQNPSDDALSSARNSISEHSHEEESSPTNKGKERARPASLQIVPATVIGSGDGHTPGPLSAPEGSSSNVLEGPMTARQSSPFVPAESAIVFPGQSRAPSRAPSHPHSRNPSPTPRLKNPNTSRLRQRRMSMPSLDEMLAKEQKKRRLFADEEQDRREYEHKSQSVNGYLLFFLYINDASGS
jgi:hypothetical protein